MKSLITSRDQYEIEYKSSVEDPESFWSGIAEDFLWHKKWDKVLDWNFDEPKFEWFKGAKFNITENLLDRHLTTKANYPAIIWEPNDPNDPGISISYQQLYYRVCNFANVLKAHHVKKGDRVCIYMPMVPEAAIAILACARIGAIHSVVFAGFSAHALAERLNDAQCKVLITSDGGFRGNKEILIKNIADEALASSPTVKSVLVFQRTGSYINMTKGRDYWWHDETPKHNNTCPAQEMDAEDMLFILYTSGSTGKPKGVVHTCAGYMVSV